MKIENHLFQNQFTATLLFVPFFFCIEKEYEWNWKHRRLDECKNAMFGVMVVG